MKKIFIHVSGRTAQGKTIAAVAIEKALKDLGFKVLPFRNQDGDADAKRQFLAEGVFSEIPTSEIEVEIREVPLPFRAPVKPGYFQRLLAALLNRSIETVRPHIQFIPRDRFKDEPYF